jgi:CheY-like chemotaxis protein
MNSSLGTNRRKYGAYMVRGGPKAPAARYIWSLYFRVERVSMIRGFLHQALVMKATRSAPVAKLVVVIDDDPLILEATEGLLRSWGCCVVTAQSCDEALVRLAETEAGRRPDVIVCDYQLSRGATGVDAIERLRSVFTTPSLLPIPATGRRLRAASARPLSAIIGVSQGSTFNPRGAACRRQPTKKQFGNGSVLACVCPK